VRRTAIGAAEALVLATIALGLVAAAVPGYLRVAVHVYVLLAAGIALVAVLARLRAAFPPPRRSLVDEALEPARHDEERLADLARLEREVMLGSASAYDQHFRLRPTLREITANLLAVRRGIDLDGRPDRAREALGADTWQLVRPDLEPPADRLARGLSAERLRHSVEVLESL
jgi:hypothetical protein